MQWSSSRGCLLGLFPRCRAPPGHAVVAVTEGFPARFFVHTKALGTGRTRVGEGNDSFRWWPDCAGKHPSSPENVPSDTMTLNREPILGSSGQAGDVLVTPGLPGRCILRLPDTHGRASFPTCACPWEGSGPAGQASGRTSLALALCVGAMGRVRLGLMGRRRSHMAYLNPDVLADYRQRVRQLGKERPSQGAVTALTLETCTLSWMPS